MRPPEHLPHATSSSAKKGPDFVSQRNTSEMTGIRRSAWLCIALASIGVLYEFSLGFFRDSLVVWLAVGLLVVVAAVMGSILCVRGDTKGGGRVLAAVGLPIGLVVLLIFIVGGGFHTMAN